MICTEVLTPGDPRHSVLVRLGVPFDEIESCRIALARSWASSIDMFIATRADHRRVAKLATALAIASCEVHNQLFFAEPTQDWFRLLWRYLQGGRPVGEMPSENVVFVTFNYDRSLEHALYNGFACGYGKAPSDIKAKMPRVMHAYGDLGEYLPDDDPGGSPGRRYAEATTLRNIEESAGRIKAIGEGTGSLSAEISTVLQVARTIVFLGFGYDTENLKLLQMLHPDRLIHPSCQVLGTAMGLEDGERYWVQRQIGAVPANPGVGGNHLALLGDKVTDCLQFLRENRRYLE